MLAALSVLTPRSFFWAAIFGLLCGIAVQTVRLGWAQTTIATERAARADLERQRAEAAAEFTRKVSVLERTHAAEQQRLSDAFQAEKDRLAADVDRLRADGDRLRSDVAAWAARATGAESDTAACRNLRNRAGTLGNLFLDADKLAEKLARAAEQRNAEVKALKQQLDTDRTLCGFSHKK